MGLSDRTVKALLLITNIFLLLSVFIVFQTPPAEAYEASVYNAYPFYFWIFLIVPAAIIQMLLIFAPSTIKGRRWFFATIIPLLIIDLLLFFMPTIRGYAVYGRGDVLTHIGWCKEILASGHIAGSDMYPIDHILAVGLSELMGVKVELLSNLISAFFSILFIFSIFLFARKIMRNGNMRNLIVVFITIPLLGIGYLTFAPHPQSLALIPLILFLGLKQTSASRNIPFSLMLLSMIMVAVFFHPLAPLVIIPAFLVLSTSRPLLHLLGGREMRQNRRGMTYIVILTGVAFFIWYSYARAIISQFRGLANLLSGLNMDSQFQKYTDILGNVNPSLVDFIQLLLNTYGQGIILGALSIVIILYLIPRIKQIHTGHVFVSVSFLFFAFMAFALLFFIPLVSFYRIYMIAMIFSCVLIPAGLMVWINNEKKTRQISISWRKSATFMIVLLLTIFSIFNLYPSPIIKAGNQQTTATEIEGIKAFFEQRDMDIEVLELGIFQTRLFDYEYGPDEPKGNLVYGATVRPIDHLGYANGTSFGHNYEDIRYFILTDYGRNYSEDLFPEYEDLWRYTPSDFSKLSHDDSVNLIQSNGGLDVYILYPI